MGLTYEQCKQLGIEHLHPLHSGLAEQAERSRAVREDLDLTTAKVSRGKPADGMNKTERAFAETLKTAPGVAWWLNHSLKLRLAGRTWYTPDFMVWPKGEPLTFVEIKGFMRDDAAVKIKVAAELYPQFRWLLVYRDGRHAWDVREITRTGIGAHPITVPWINGGTA
jgi:hypothetical protein